MGALQDSDDPRSNAHDLKMVAEEYIARFPDFGGVEDAVNFYADAVQNGMGARHKRNLSSVQALAIEAELQGLKARHRGSPLARYVDQKIARVGKPKGK